MLSLIQLINSIHFYTINLMTQRHYSLEEISSITHSIEKDKNKVLREAGSTSNLLGAKSTIGFTEDMETIGDYKYRKRDQIGSGYTSHVYRCRSIKTDQQFAVKIIQLKKYTSSSLEMLDYEIQILKKLNHPNIIRFQNVYRTATHCFLITQFCGFGDLLQYITKCGKLIEKQAVSITNQIVEAVKYLFKMGVIHRDIKPANIFKGGKSWKLGDFGFAINGDGEMKTRHNVGTPLYMPLESLLRNIYSPESDIFAVGVILYEMMIGITPWQCKSEKELIKRMSTVPFYIPEKYKISTPIKYLLSKLCAVNKDERMSKEQFMELVIGNFNSLNTFNEYHKQNLQIKRKGRLFSVGKLTKQISKNKETENQYLVNRKKSKNQLKSVPKVEMRTNSKNKIIDIKTYRISSRQSSTSSEKQFQSKLQQKNYEILICYLNFCRFMYYLIENNMYLQINNLNRGRLSLVLFKHLLKMIKHLSDNKNNWFGFTNWDSFRKSQKYQTTYKTLKQYCEKYEKQYLSFLKKAQINVIKEINQKLPQFSTNQQFTITFYRKILSFVGPIMKENNQNLPPVIKHLNQSKDEENIPKMQCLRSLYRYYKIVQISLRQFQNYTYFVSNSNIFVTKNYRNSQITMNQFMQIRQEIKMI